MPHVVERYAYDPYGQVTVLDGESGYDADGSVTEWSADAGGSDWGNEIRFAGHRLDPESGLYHVRRRMYHPTLGRLMQRDPLGYVDGMVASQGDHHMSQSLRVLAIAGAAVLAWAGVATAAEPATLRLNLRTQALKPDAGGHNQWQAVAEARTVKAPETAILLCDVWDKHWSRGATERVAALAPRINETVKAARALGVTIVHAPSETMAFYEDTPARKRMKDAPASPLPPPMPHDNPPLPIDDSDGGSDTGEKPWHKAWTRQHPAIEIDQERDGVSDNGQEIWNFLQARGIRNLVVLGVHTNMCILNRPFAIKAMVPRGMNVALVRDLTDAMYNPAQRPYVSHDEGTRLVIEYIEKFWCPTILAADLVKPSP